MDAELSCRCGQVRARLTNASPHTVNRVMRYCDDFQAFLHHLGRLDLLDAHGGTDIVQVAPAFLSLVSGKDRVDGIRLTAKGLYRWYASCCKTPLGNTVSPAIPFVGIIAQAFESDTQKPVDLFGKPIGAVFTRFAVGESPGASKRFNARLLARAILMVLGWRLRGKSWPHPYFDRVTRAPIFGTVSNSDAKRSNVARGSAASKRLPGVNPSAGISVAIPRRPELASVLHCPSAKGQLLSAGEHAYGMFIPRHIRRQEPQAENPPIATVKYLRTYIAKYETVRRKELYRTKF